MGKKLDIFMGKLIKNVGISFKPTFLIEVFKNYKSTSLILGIILITGTNTSFCYFLKFNLFTSFIICLLGPFVYRGLYLTVEEYRPPRAKEIAGKSGVLPIDLGNGLKLDIFELNMTLVAGLPGAGKSNFISKLVQSSVNAGNNMLIVVFDFKIVDSEELKDSQYFKVFNTYEELLNYSGVILSEMDKRYKELAKYRAKKFTEYNKSGGNMPAILFIIDEVADISEIENKDQKVEILRNLKLLLRKGRAAGIYSLFATQRPTNTQILSDITALMDCRVLFKQNNTRGAVYDGIAENLSGLGIGECLIKSIPYDGIVKIGKALDLNKGSKEALDLLDRVPPKAVIELKTNLFGLDQKREIIESKISGPMKEFINYLEKCDNCPTVKEIMKEFSVTEKKAKNLRKEAYELGYLAKKNSTTFELIGKKV